MHYYIAKINDDNRRPGMPETGYIVRWELSDYGWKNAKSFEKLEDAEAFAAELVK